MKYSILFSIFGVVVGFSSLGWGQSCPKNMICIVSGGQGPNGQVQQQGPNQAQCLAKGVDDCTLTGCNPYTVNGGHKYCMSQSYYQSCKGGWDSSGYCTSNQADDVKNADVNAVTSESAKACRDSVNSAQDKCDPNKSQDVGAVMQMATGVQQALSMAAGSSIQAACGGLGKVSEAAATATAVYKGYCSYAYSQCQKSCNTALADPSAEQDKMAVKKLLAQCNGMTQNIAEASNAVMGLLGTVINMKQCASLETDCTLNPTAPTCIASTDCTNATVASTNLVCICQANPADSRCGGSSTASLGGFGSPTVPSSGSTTDGSLGNFGIGNDSLSSLTPPGANSGTNQQPQNMAMGMQGGHNLGNTSGVNNAYTPPGAGNSSGGSKAGVLSGYYGGSGGGFGFGSSGSGSGSNGYGGSGAGGLAGRQGGLDLKQFLPGGAKDPARGIAGISGPDGITGPNSDIWQKVNTRYYSVSPSLLP
jgi:hypothetical protein